MSTLQMGDQGPAVSTLQRQLKEAGHHVSVDGEFGPRTRAAVEAFQREHGLTADGVVGPKTWAVVDSLEVETES
jgi:peptidoglycan hydrolase-like protein with peptidoglycan-binding domain